MKNSLIDGDADRVYWHASSLVQRWNDAHQPGQLGDAVASYGAMGLDMVEGILQSTVDLQDIDSKLRGCAWAATFHVPSPVLKC